MEEETLAKWEGEISGEIKTADADEIWSFFADFCNLHKWFPIDTCYHVEGVSGQPGLIRYCGTTKTSSSSGGCETTTTAWVKEKLLLFDPDKRVLSYEVTENNIGFKSYVATIKVLPCPVAGEESSGCKIVWTIVCDPIEGWNLEGLKEFLESYLQYMEEKVNLLKKSG